MREGARGGARVSEKQPSLFGGEEEQPEWASAPVTKTELTLEPIAVWEARATRGPIPKRNLRAKGPNGAMIGQYGRGPESATCGSCAHLFRYRHHDYSYFKCRKHGVTNGPGTDHRKKWPACRLYLLGQGDIESEYGRW